MEKGFINFIQSELDKPIFRIFTVQRLLEVFDEKALTLVKPSKWDDPFENYLMKSNGVRKDGTAVSMGFRDHFYGQCWTKRIESDALWRIYAHDKNGVKVKTTPRKLLTALLLQNPQPNNINLTCFIGKVKYFKTDVLKGFFNEVEQLVKDPSGQGQAKTLLLKRKQFDHEREVRLIFNSEGKVPSDIYKLGINPLDLIDGIVFDPRMSEAMYKVFRKHFVDIGFTKKIIRSGLYKEPSFTFQMKN